MGYAVKLKVANHSLEFRDDYHFDRLTNIEGEIEILGLSPWNDFHIFEAIDKADLRKCTYYYFSQEQCDKISELLPTLASKKLIDFVPVTDFWREMDEK